MSEDRAEAINLGPNNPVSEAEALRQETVAGRVNPGDPSEGEAAFPEATAKRITPGPNDLEQPTEKDGVADAEALDRSEHRFNEGPQS